MNLKFCCLLTYKDGPFPTSRLETSTLNYSLFVLMSCDKQTAGVELRVTLGRGNLVILRALLCGRQCPTPAIDTGLAGKGAQTEPRPTCPREPQTALTPGHWQNRPVSRRSTLALDAKVTGRTGQVRRGGEEAPRPDSHISMCLLANKLHLV